jgi:polyhydroxyalkanoate synthesis regulator phasin
MSKGCLIALIIGGIIFFVVIALGVVCYVYKDQLVEMGLSKMTETIVTEVKNNLPEGMRAEEVDALMDDFKKAFKEGRIDQGEIQHISTMLQGMFEDKKIDQDEGRKLIEELKKAIKD